MRGEGGGRGRGSQINVTNSDIKAVLDFAEFKDFTYYDIYCKKNLSVLTITQLQGESRKFTQFIPTFSLDITWNFFVERSFLAIQTGAILWIQGSYSLEPTICPPSIKLSISYEPSRET